VTAMSAVTPVHEDVHERAGEDEEVGQVAKRVRKVLGPKENACDDQEGRAHEKRSRRPETAFPLVTLMMLRVIVNGHAGLLSFNNLALVGDDMTAV